MRWLVNGILVGFAVLVLMANGTAQVDDICGEAGLAPSMDSPFAHVPYIFGKVTISGFDDRSKLPRVVVTLIEGQRPAERWSVGPTGNYCFRRRATGGSLLVEVDGVEVARRSLPSFGPSQQREDFEVQAATVRRAAAPVAVSVKFTHPRNEKTVALYESSAEAAVKKDIPKAIAFLKQVVTVDPQDFIGWAKLGTLQFEVKDLAESEASFRRSLELRIDYTPAWLSVGMIRVAQRQFPAAIEIFKHAASLDPASARAFQLLGEAYLQAKQGSLGVQALNEAIRLDPIGMADCHLQLAHLYQLAGANHLAAGEYKLYLAKIPDHPEKKKYEKYIRENSDSKK